MHLHPRPCSSRAWALCAQTVVFATDTPYGVFARNGAASDHDFLAALSPITAPVGVAAGVTGASARCDLAPDPRAIKIGEAGQVTVPVVSGRLEAGTTPSLPPGTIQQGPHSLLMKITSPLLGSVRGRIAIALRGSADAGSKGRLAVDIGNDSQVDYEQAVDGQPHAQEFVVVFTGSLAVKIVTDCVADRTGAVLRSSYSLEASVEFLPGPPPFQFTQYGQGCGGLTLDGKDDVVGNLHHVTISAAGAFPGSRASSGSAGARSTSPYPARAARSISSPRSRSRSAATRSATRSCS
jgi:hypothetical protein